MSAQDIITQVSPDQNLGLPALRRPFPRAAGPQRSVHPPLDVPVGVDPVQAAANAARSHFRNQQRHALIAQGLPAPSDPEPEPSAPLEPSDSAQGSSSNPATVVSQTDAPSTPAPDASQPAEPESQSGPSGSFPQQPSRSGSGAPDERQTVTALARPTPPRRSTTDLRSGPNEPDEKQTTSPPTSQSHPSSPTKPSPAPVRHASKPSVFRRLFLILTCSSVSTEDMSYNDLPSSPMNEKSPPPHAQPMHVRTQSPASSSPGTLAPPNPSRDGNKENRISGSGTSYGGSLATGPSILPKRDLASPSPDGEVPGHAPTLTKTNRTASSLASSSKNEPLTLERGESADPTSDATHTGRALSDIPEPSSQEGSGSRTPHGLQAPSMKHKASVDSRWTRDSRHSSAVFGSGQSMVGGTVLPRDETEDVLSGAVVPPGSTFAPPTPDRQHHSFPNSSSLADAAVPPLNDSARNSAIALPVSEQSLLLASHDHEPPTEETLADIAILPDDRQDDQEDGIPTAAPTEADTEVEADLDVDQADYFDDQWLQWELDEEQRLIQQGGAGIPHDELGNPMPLLDELLPIDQGRKCLVLDLDETLVHSSFKMIPNADFVVPVEIEDVVHSVYVIKRPGVNEFLKRMADLFEIVVFTASLSKYADPVLDLLDTNNVVRHRLFRESCYQHRGTFVKDLSQLGRPVPEVIILDNSPASYIFHSTNAVPVSSWFSDPHDTELLDMCPFLADLVPVEDVRAVLDGAL